MKKIIFILVFLFAILMFVNSQTNTLYLTLQPCDYALGVRFDHKYHNQGLYSIITHGNYYYVGGSIKNHWKLSIGAIQYLPYLNDVFGGSQSYLSAGICYHHYGKYTDNFELIDHNIFNAMSYDLGVGIRIKHFTLGIRKDMVKKEGGVDLGYCF